MFIKSNPIQFYLKHILRAFQWSYQLTIDPLQNPPGFHLGGLWPDAVDSLWAKSQEEDEDYCDQEAGEQQSGHDDDLLLVHPDLWQAATTGTIVTHTSGVQSSYARLSTSSTGC